MYNRIKCKTRFIDNQLVLINPSQNDLSLMFYCQKCGKSLVPTSGGLSYGMGNDFFEKIKSRTTYCKACKIALCLGCAHEEGMKTKDKSYVCPKCQSEVPEAVAWTYQEVSNKSCFIATACYNDFNHPNVILLRKYRDEVLLYTILGRIFVNTYYLLSPPIAKWLSSKRRIKLFFTKMIEYIVMYIKNVIYRN